MSSITAGPQCRNCPATEQRCAFLQGCCAACSHWLRYDENGNPRPVNSPHPQGSHKSDLRTLKRTRLINHSGFAKVAPTEAATSMVGATTGTSTKPAGPSWPFALFDNKPTHCAACGRRTPWRTDGTRTRTRHRVEADNPLAPHCTGDAS